MDRLIKLAPASVDLVAHVHYEIDVVLKRSVTILLAYRALRRLEHPFIVRAFVTLVVAYQKHTYLLPGTGSRHCAEAVNITVSSLALHAIIIHCVRLKMVYHSRVPEMSCRDAGGASLHGGREIVGVATVSHHRTGSVGHAFPVRS